MPSRRIERTRHATPRSARAVRKATARRVAVHFAGAARMNDRRRRPVGPAATASQGTFSSLNFLGFVTVALSFVFGN